MMLKERVIMSPDYIGAAVGAVLGFLVGQSYMDSLTANPISNGTLMSAFGVNWPIWLTIVNVLSGAAIFFVMVRTIAHLFIQNRMTDPSQISESAKHYDLPAWIQPKSKFSVTLGEVHNGDQYVLNPTWARIPESGLYGNIITYGGIGSGKTAAVANPIMQQIMEYQPHNEQRKMGGLVLDVKGDFAEFVRNLAIKYDRTQDVISVSGDGAVKWNPIDEPNTPPETLAGRLVSVYQNITQDTGSGDNAWVTQGVLKHFSNSIGILREIKGYITIDDCNRLIDQTSTGEIESTNNYLQEIGFQPSAKNERLTFHHRYFMTEWSSQNDRTRSIIQSACKNVTGLFSTPEIRTSFSPPKEQINFRGFDEVIDNGQIVLIDLPDAQYGVLANAVGTLLKLSFQRSALARVARAKNNPQTNTYRSLFFVCDEYQKFVSVSGSAGEGDEQFYALSRQSKCFSLVLTQSPQSIIAKIGKEAAQVMFASLRTKLFLAMVNPDDAELAAKTMGEDWQDIENVSFSETVQNASFNTVDASVSGTDASMSESRQLQKERRYLIEPIKITQLKTFECFASLFNGIQQQPPQKIFLKTDFIPKVLKDKYTDPRKMPYNELMKAFEQSLIEEN